GDPEAARDRRAHPLVHVDERAGNVGASGLPGRGDVVPARDDDHAIEDDVADDGRPRNPERAGDASGRDRLPERGDASPRGRDQHRLNYRTAAISDGAWRMRG